GEESVKRRKFAAALVFLATLLVAALAAASVSAATSSHKATTASGKGIESKKLKSQAARKVGTGQFTPTGPSSTAFIGTAPSKDSFYYKQVTGHDRGIPGKHSGQKAPSGQAGQAPSAPFIPHAHSLPITHQSYAGSTPGLNAYDQESTGGYIDTPPDQALA